MPDVFIISAVRTPLAPRLPLKARDLAALVMQEAILRSGIDPDRLEELVWAGSEQGGMRADAVRQAAIQAGITGRAALVTVECSGLSGQQALHSAAQMILGGDAELVITGGCEQWTPKAIPRMASEREAADAETTLDLSMEELANYRNESRKRARQAVEAGWLDRQIVPITPAYRQDEILPASENPVTHWAEALPGSGAAALVLASAKAVGRLNLAPLVRLVSRSLVGCGQLSTDPSRAGQDLAVVKGMAAATRVALQQAGLSMQEIDIFEIDERCAACVLAWEREFQPEIQRVNPTGGALALGHPSEAAGAIWATCLAHELSRTHQQYGLLIGTAPQAAAATVIERV